MTLKELRKYKHITQLEASILTDIPLRTYKRIENDPIYVSTHKYKHAFTVLSDFNESSSMSGETYKPKHILVIGAGYVGLSIAVLLSTDNKVSIIDINKDKVDKLNKREPLFKDKEIEFYLKNKKLDLTAYIPNKELYKNVDYIIIAIPTDYDEISGELNTSNIVSLIDEIRSINKSAPIIIKSTCNIGFCDTLTNKRNIFYSPEFLREGKALYDNLYPTRIIIGGDISSRYIKEFGHLLARHALNRPKVLYMAYKEAEAVKLFSNSYLALRVAYFNELDSFALKNGLSSKNITLGVSSDNRIGDYYNNPSFGYGGYCLPKDTLSLIHSMDEVIDNGLISSIDRSNQKRKEFIILDILERLKDKKYPIIGVYSVASKKGSDNKRYSSILDVIKGLENKGINILYYDESKMDISFFKKKCDLILLNRHYEEFSDVMDKIYTRDIFNRD